VDADIVTEVDVGDESSACPDRHAVGKPDAGSERGGFGDHAVLSQNDV
jgi:hypothetical protein